MKTNKYLTLSIFLFFSTYAFSQTINKKEILTKEVYRYQEKYKTSPTLVNDSLVVAYQKNNYLNNCNNLKNQLINAQLISNPEAEEVFGNDKDIFFEYKINESSQWCTIDFEALKVKLFIPKKRVLNNYHVFSFSETVFRNDNKYALILISSRNEGGVLSIYQNTETGWILYKSIQLFYI